jgi:hypothetical protein
LRTSNDNANNNDNNDNNEMGVTRRRTRNERNRQRQVGRGGRSIGRAMAGLQQGSSLLYHSFFLFLLWLLLLLFLLDTQCFMDWLAQCIYDMQRGKHLLFT